MLFINVQVQQNCNRNCSEDDEAQAHSQLQPTQQQQTSPDLKVTWHARGRVRSTRRFDAFDNDDDDGQTCV